MEQKFIKFEEAVEKLGISGERLNELREAGDLRAYRDGSSWKFRTDEIDKLLANGLPEISPPSDIGLASIDELVDAAPLNDSAKFSDLDDLGDLALADDDDLDVMSGSSHDFSELAGDPSDSILLTDESLGGLAEQPPSTIIGKSDDLDADLQLIDEDDDAAGDAGLVSSGASDVHSSGVGGSGVLDDLATETGHASAFEGIEELELDLESEASRIHQADEVAAAKTAASKQAAAIKAEAEASDLRLEGSSLLENESDVALAATDDEGTDPVPAEMASSDAQRGTGDSDVDLDAASEDFVLADSSGSDITLDSADSGINLVEPGDSGVALDDIPLDIGGSAILSSLSLDSLGSDADISLVSDVGGSDAPLAELQTDDDFQLTPLSEGAIDDDDSSSQVIALDADMEGLDAGDGGILGEDAFAEDAGGDVALAEDYDAAGGLAVAGYGGALAARGADSEFTVWNIVGLSSAALLLFMGVSLMFDMVRNIWSWNEPYALNSALLDAICGLFGLR